MAKRLLIKGGCVLSLDRSVGNHAEADVLIEDGVIAEIGPGLRGRDAEVIDASDTIVMPGFVDTHRHAWKSLFRNEGAQPSSESPYGADDIYAATLVGLLGAVEAGITTVVDWSDIESDDAMVEAALAAHHDSGLRTVLVHKDGGGPIGPPGSTTRALGSSLPVSKDLDAIAAEWRSARERGARIHLHVGLDLSESGSVSALASAGLLGGDVTLVHCSNLAADDLDAISASGSKVSFTPSSEMSNGIGSPPVQEFLDRKIRPGLGIDNEASGQGDMYAQMRAAISLQHATSFDLKLAGKGSLPGLLSTREVIRWATLDGAVAVGLDTVTGSLSPGKRADLIVLRTDRPNVFPINDPIGAVVWGMDTSNVDWVFVNGEALLGDGVITADGSRARTLASEALSRVGAELGEVVEAGQGVDG